MIVVVVVYISLTVGIRRRLLHPRELRPAARRRHLRVGLHRHHPRLLRHVHLRVRLRHQRHRDGGAAEEPPPRGRSFQGA